MKHKPTKS